ncbi:cytosolic sulfotransferase 2-like [Etheostoma cragini]|uniref:cytosolic sulfotransferase 2-like n=1 Tax=Etheostoma cragini TaxID=417921 RepID=UPI00155E047D|nr:cytosolic sulfotransferase 2-like [Etheostoma cragini]
MDVISRPELFDFHGVCMTHYFTDNWEKIQNFQARPDDILIDSYPKAGCTWLSYILDLLCHEQTSIPLFQRVPNLEIAVPSLQKGIIYVARNAKDSVVSYFHYDYMSKIQPEPGDWSCYLQRFMEGKVAFGSWYDHVNGWWEKKQSYPKLHYMFYEDLIEDTGREIDKLCCFLGLSPSAEEKERITSSVQFDVMKKNNTVNLSTVPMYFKRPSFMRKGKVGDWRNHFTVTQDEKFDADYKLKIKNTTLQFRTGI